MNCQMIAAPTMEIAMGKKTIALAYRSQLLRSASTATISPSTTTSVAPTRIQATLLMSACCICRCWKTAT